MLAAGYSRWRFAALMARFSSTGALAPGERVEAARRLLGVDRGTSSGDLRRTFEGVALAQHPDREGGDAAAFAASRDAFEVLRPLAREAGGWIDAVEAAATTSGEVDAYGRTSEYRRTVPVLFLHGGHRDGLWASTQARLAKLGFASRAAVTARASSFGALDEELRAVEQLSADGERDDTEDAGPWHVPPLVVAHGLGAFVAQRFAETNRVSGLVLVEPCPPAPEAYAARLLSEATADDDGLDAARLLADLASGSCALEYDFDDSYEVLVVAPGDADEDLESVADWYGLDVSDDDEEALDACSGWCACDAAGDDVIMAHESWDRDGGLSDRIVRWIDDTYAF